MANLITVTSWSKLAAGETMNAAATPLTINVKNILYVQTRGTAYRTTGITNLIYELPYNQVRYQVTLVVTEAVAAIITAAG